VNLSEQQIYAYEGDVLVNSFIVSTGLPDTPTVTGEFNIYVKVPMQDMSGPGYYLSDVPWVMFFYDDYGFHGTYWHNNFGSPMSRGCVNLRTEDAEWLFHWASVGTRVVVHY
jgi:lipoprotein-anchoring transpeptidase ErfK/SrfK